jgi:hypothetical protein
VAEEESGISRWLDLIDCLGHLMPNSRKSCGHDAWIGFFVTVIGILGSNATVNLYS